MEPKCPRWGEPCIKHECAFWDKVPATGDYECRDKLTNMMLDDVANYLHLLLKSSEGNRETGVQMIKSGLQQEVTPELKRLVGVKES